MEINSSLLLMEKRYLNFAHKIREPLRVGVIRIGPFGSELA